MIYNNNIVKRRHLVAMFLIYSYSDNKNTN